MSDSSDIGVIGAATMATNLALNFERNGYSVVIFNRTFEKLRDFLDGRAAGKCIRGARTLQEFVGALATPRKVLLMVKAGPPVDEFLEKLLPLLAPGDLLIDGGNSHPSDTERRFDLVESRGMYYCGMGISGGESGALNGPSIMPGCRPEVWPLIEGPFQAISAKFHGEPCCRWIGPRSAGHYVKMDHNGIEYVIMQAICDAYWMLKRVLGLSNPQIAATFDRWNKTEVGSYLLKIARRVLLTKDNLSDADLIDRILDAAKGKGTGKWTAQLAMDLGVPSSLVSAAVHARDLSAAKLARVRASEVLRGPDQRPFAGDPEALQESLRQALYATMICAYAQGFIQLQAAAAANGWGLSMTQIASIWRRGCIIQSRMLEPIVEAFTSCPDLENLLLAPHFTDAINAAQNAWRDILEAALTFDPGVPALASARIWYDGCRAGDSSANLLQAMRDYFGAHGYQRTDRPGELHFPWPADIEPDLES